MNNKFNIGETVIYRLDNKSFSKGTIEKIQMTKNDIVYFFYEKKQSFKESELCDSGGFKENDLYKYNNKEPETINREISEIYKKHEILAVEEKKEYINNSFNFPNKKNI